MTPELEQKKNLSWRWQQHTFRAMNTQVEAWLYSHTEMEVLAEVQRLFHSFEKRLSRFDPASELSKLNAHPGAEPFVASTTLLDALEVALLATQATGGLYDPTLLTDLEKAGYDRRFDQIVDPAPLQPDFIGFEGIPTPPPTRRSVTFVCSVL